MTRVAVVGAGQAGAQLALGLLRRGHDVTLVSDRSPDDLRRGAVLSSQCMFDSALAVERQLGLDRWAAECPDIMAFRMTVPGTTWSAPLEGPARSVDQRVKLPVWIEQFAAEGGTVVLGPAGVTELEDHARTHDLVVVATGTGELGRLFAPDPARSTHDRPQRVLALTYVHGMTPLDDGVPAVSYTAIPGVGEYFTLPALTTSGPCDIMVFEGIPGGPMDRWDDVTESGAHLERSLDLLKEFAPHEYERCAAVRLTDDGGVLRGRITPGVRRPVAYLPSGRPVLGIGDAVVLNDPISGQGANLAAHAAGHYLEAVERHDGAFDAAWMNRTFEQFWRGWAQWTVEWTTAMLAPPRPHVQELLAEAAEVPGIAAAIANAFDDPRQAFRWWFDESAATRFRTEMRAAQDGRFDRREFRTALGQYATGVAVVTARGADGRKVGMTANSFTSVSMDPPMVLWCPGKNAPSLPAFSEATHFAVNVLAADQEHLSRQFSTPSADKFAELELTDGTGGAPVLPGAVARFECRTVRCVDAGDHVVFLGEVENFCAPGGVPLVFHGGLLRALAG
ncbi:flavin reductase [Amycolatopsis jejuensis]|uniref:flavin reductase n=1 Tax=Amycolatopsis jejuensis TaxID=330084 RepID=UPI0005253258|nr:flavin reductase [Amycolatopsis jejuensis]